jgi:hypothetical protein
MNGMVPCTAGSGTPLAGRDIAPQRAPAMDQHQIEETRRDHDAQPVTIQAPEADRLDGEAGLTKGWSRIRVSQTWR